MTAGIDLEAEFCIKNHNLETNNLNPKPEILQTNTLSAFITSQKTKRACLINHVTTRAMIKLPKANPQATPQHQIHKQILTGKADAQSRRRRRKCYFIQEFIYDEKCKSIEECIYDEKCVCTENTMHG